MLRDSRRADRRRAARHQPDRLRAPRAGATATSFRVGYFARIAPEKGCTCSPTPTRASARAHARRADAARGRRLPGAGAGARISTSVKRRSRARPGSADEFTYHGAVDRDGKLAFLRTLDVLSVPAPYDEPKGVFLLEAMARGRSGRAAAARRVHRDRRADRRRPARGARRRRRRSPTGCYVSGSDRAPARDARPSAASTASASTTPSRARPIGCSRCTTTPPIARASIAAPSGLPAPLLQVTDLTKEYPTPRGALRVLSDVSFTLAPGDAAAIMGPSGSGKSSLLYILGGLEPPTSGTVTLDGRNPFQLDASGLAAFRNKEIGFVFQDHCLLPQCTVLENVLVPTLVAPAIGDDRRARAHARRAGRPRRSHRSPAGARSPAASGSASRSRAR